MVNGASSGMQDLIDDAHDQRLLGHVHPRGWVDPRVAPGQRYNLIAIGGGTAGLVSAMGTAGLRGKAALIERHLLGGDCLNFGCVPSKALIAAAHAAHAARGGEPFGVRLDGQVTLDFARAMERLRRLRADIAEHDGAARLTQAGVDVFLGAARFTGPDTVLVGGQTLRFARCVIATGARAVVPPIPGVERVTVHTNETIFTLTDLPKRLAVVGGGPIGCELAQAFARFGSEVRLFDLAPRLLGKDDPDAAALVRARLEADGVTMTLGAKLLRFERSTDKDSVVVFNQGQGEERHACDAVLMATGRRAQVDGLGLEAAGVAYGKAGIAVDDRLRTSNRRIYAAGDCCSAFQFTHAADAMARIVIQNALFFGRKKMSKLVIPWATYTDPEVAHVGLGIDELAARGDALTTITVPMAEIDRAICDGQTDGFARFHVDKKGRIAAATVVARHAGDLISEVSLALTHHITMAGLAATIHPYPTQSEVLKRAGDQFNRTRLTPGLAAWLECLLRWRR